MSAEQHQSVFEQPDMTHNRLQSSPIHHAETLIRLFNNTFFDQYNTRLVAGEDEPIYLPADKECTYHRIVFAHGFFSSALHEVAHWCVAGEARRAQVDYGYWYEPDGRNAIQQAEFQKVEVKPQAIEWAFSIACGHPFSVSLDNLDGETNDSVAFSAAVANELSRMRKGKFPERAQRFIEALQRYYFPATNAAPLSSAQCGNQTKSAQCGNQTKNHSPTKSISNDVATTNSRNENAF